MKKKLLTPGPVPLSPELLKELTRPIIHHRTSEFSALFKEVLTKLKLCFQTDNPILVLTATGTGAMQAALTNSLSPKDKVIFLINGNFGQRWADMAKVFGLDVICYEVDWGQALDPKKVEQELQKHKDIKAVFCQACETSTGAANPIKKISEKIAAYSSETLFIVDGITAVGVSNIQMDKDGIDILVAGAQKAFTNPTGLSFIGLSQKAQRALETSRIPKYYFDLKRELAANKKFQTAFSSPVTLLFLLNKSLDELNGDNLKKHIKTCQNRKKAIVSALKEFSLNIFCEPSCSSLTVFNVPPNIDGTKLKSRLEDNHGIVIAGGQAHLKGKILRVGHMGYIPKENYADFITSLFTELNQMGYKLTKEDLRKALAHIDKI